MHRFSIILIKYKIRVLVLFAIAIVFGCKEENNGDTFEYDPPPKGKIVAGKVASSIVDTDVHYSIYLPPGYDSANIDFPVLYLLHGLGGDHRQWVSFGMEGIMNQAIDDGDSKKMVVVMPNGFSYFYCNNYQNNGIMYEDFFIDELMPQIETDYNVKAGKANTAIAGLSMGGYGATYLAFRHADRFGSCYAMSPAYYVGAPEIEGEVNAMTSTQLDALPPLTIEIGTEDFLLSNNAKFTEFLDDKEIEHEYVTRPGGHDDVFWKAALPKVLEFVTAYFD